MIRTSDAPNLGNALLEHFADRDAIQKNRQQVPAGVVFIRQLLSQEPVKSVLPAVLCCWYCLAAVPESELLRFLAHVRSDPTLRQIMADALTADEVSLLAKERRFLVSGSDILRFLGLRDPHQSYQPPWRISRPLLLSSILNAISTYKTKTLWKNASGAG